jgi:hypothetical protein
VYRIACGVAFLLIACSSVRAQDPAIDDLKGKIFDARMAQQTLGDGLKYCPELNGKSFHFRVRNRILDLEEYFHSLENLVKAQTFNPDKRRPWSFAGREGTLGGGEEAGAGRQGEMRAGEEPPGTRETAGGVAEELRGLWPHGLNRVPRCHADRSSATASPGSDGQCRRRERVRGEGAVRWPP